MGINPYYNDRNVPLLRKSFCVYLDILGFSKQIKDASNSGMEDKLFAQLHSIFETANKEFSFENDEPKPNMWKYKFFTDNLVLGLPHNPYIHSEAEYGALLFPLLRYQLFLTLNGLFLRGALTAGSLHVGTDIVFGQSLLDAYELENTKALNPRIILSEEMSALVKNHASKFYASPIESPQNADFFIDADGQVFLNYLGAAVDDTHGSYTINWDLIHQHKYQVENHLKEFSSHPTIWAKYNWVANYHNFFCGEVENLAGYEKELKISSPNHKNNPSRLFEI